MLEVHVAGDRKKDEKTNVERYARLGIQEYFYFDRARLRVAGHRLPSASSRVYQHIVRKPAATRRACWASISRSKAAGSASSPAARRWRTPTR